MNRTARLSDRIPLWVYALTLALIALGLGRNLTDGLPDSLGGWVWLLAQVAAVVIYSAAVRQVFQRRAGAGAAGG